MEPKVAGNWRASVKVRTWSQKRMLFFSIALLCGLLVLCVALGLSPGTRSLTIGHFEGVIFGKKAAARTLGSMLTNEKGGYWTPKRNDILAMETQLSARVLGEYSQLATDLVRYRRQYFGITRGGSRKVYVVGFCGVVDRDWSREFVSTADSGDCHFEGEYDVASGRLSYFWVLTE